MDSIVQPKSAQMDENSAARVETVNSVYTNYSSRFSLWYLCQFCPRGFRKSKDFIEHKVQCHLPQFLKSQQRKKPRRKLTANTKDLNRKRNDNESRNTLKDGAGRILEKEEFNMKSAKGKTCSRLRRDNYLQAKVETVRSVKVNGRNGYECSQCKKIIRNRVQFTDHQFMHLGQRPHKCLFCPKAFSWSHYRKIHQNKCIFRRTVA